MKKYLIILAGLAACVLFVVYFTLDTKPVDEQELKPIDEFVENVEYAVETDGYVHNNHKYVDLGLPSGTLWANCNLGASLPHEAGDYFQWGEAAPHAEGVDYDLKNYQHSDGEKYTKYTSGELLLQPDDDAAHVLWGGAWRMPTVGEWAELCDTNYCNWEWESNPTFTGYYITSRIAGHEKAKLLLPAAGYRWDSTGCCVDGEGAYWSSMAHKNYDENAWYAWFSKDSYQGNCFYRRYYGFSIRPVLQRSDLK